jgi:hypothetical protein
VEAIKVSYHNSRNFRELHRKSLTRIPVYNDAVSKQTTHFREWLSIKTPFHKSAHEFTGEMSRELEEFYLERYSLCSFQK